MRKFFHIFLVVLCTQTVFGQEIPLNSQIFMNPYYYNPAFAGFEDRPAFYVYRRQQWTGIEGAPVTIGFNFHTIFNEKVNFGIHVLNDERSILSTTKGLLTFGYRASFDDEHYLSFALSGGAGFNNIDLDAIDPNDPAILDALDNNIFLDGNAGFNYHNKGFNIGLSLPRIFETKTISNSAFTPGEISPLNDAILTSSFKLKMADGNFAIEPFGIYYYKKDMPGQFEAIGLLHLMKVFWIGGSYRQDYGSTGFIGLNISDNFKFGYAYEFFDAQPASFNNSSHDIQLAIIFGNKEKKKKVNLMQQRRNMLRTMGKLPSEQKQEVYQVENDPFVPPTESYDEEKALQELIDEMNAEEAAEEVAEDSLTMAAIEEIDEEEELLRQMEEEAEEITFNETEELTEVTDFVEVAEATDDFVEPTLDDKGFYIGPTTVTKGGHILELDKGNYVVVATFGSYRDAEEHSDQLFMRGFYTKFGYISQTKIYYVYIFESEDLQEANDTSERFNQIGAQLRENWVLQVQ